MPTVTFDLESMTLDEMCAVETASGRDFVQLITAGSAHRKMVALYVLALRSSEPPPSWQELGAQRPQGKRSSTLPSSPAGRPSQSGD